MLYAALAIGGIGLVAAFALGVAAKVFFVEVDPLVEAIEGALPGANCGGCGQPGCSGAAAAIAAGLMPANGCVAGGAETGKKVAAILGVEVKESEPEIARVGCRYPLARADRKFSYTGIMDCRAAAQLYGGPKECPVGCIGLGSCVRSCPFDALVMGPDGLPVVLEDKCTGCGTCVRTCPVGIMRLTNVTNRILNEYTWEECTAPCQRRCPAGIDIPQQIFQTALGHYDEALRIIKERNPLPLICGRICPQPCELVCRRNLEDEPVAINNLKRFVADRERESGTRINLFKAPATGRRAAVIGGGVEGLSAAYFLARLGHSVKIFEARDQLGGLLRTAIPKNRLPREVLDWEIQGILDMGVEAQTGAGFGRQVALAQLFDDGYEAVLLAVGGWDALLEPRRMENPAQALPQVQLMLPLNLAWASGRHVDVGASVVIIDGGLGAGGVAKRCLEHGAKKVTILYGRPRIAVGLTREEQKRLAKNGITVVFGARVLRLQGKGNRMNSLVYTIGDGVDRTLEADTVISAGGRLPDMIVMKIKGRTPSLDAGEAGPPPVVPGNETPWRTEMPYPAGLRKGMFDVVGAPSDHWAAVEAIGAGRRAAVSIHRLFSDKPILGPVRDIGRENPKYDVDGVDRLAVVGPRNLMPEVGPEERLDPDRETALGLTEAAARAEADRCLNCGLICYDRTSYPPIISIEDVMAGVK